MVPNGGPDVLDGPFHLAGPTWWRAEQPSEQVYLMVEVSNLFLGGLVPNYLDGGHICLWVRPLQGMPVALVDKSLHLLLPLLGSRHEHPLEDEGAVQTPHIPSGILIQE